eukprot:NODE_388_length_1413_cov_306.021261_g286_i0.p1 GENE.NODE_388_length_1413_cov_306.021261_g286_i0~~NODE_388_length_1413_cov_306.021261_g286_i0.p1  ORF type:complete len:427 (-),score=73.74 NODE_388_length_1413_cov_306.021261_g286_i0:131-1381(-)
MGTLSECLFFSCPVTKHLLAMNTLLCLSLLFGLYIIVDGQQWRQTTFALLPKPRWTLSAKKRFARPNPGWNKYTRITNPDFAAHSTYPIQPFEGPIPQPEKGRYHACIITYVHNYYPDSLAAWLEYHHLLGVGHFFVLNKCQTDGGKVEAVLKRYKTEGWVSMFDYPPGCPENPEAPYRDWLDPVFHLARPVCTWVASLDLDEYISRSDSTRWPHLLTALYSSSFAVFRMPWWVLGSDGHEKRPPGLTIENYKHGYFGSHVKTFALARNVSLWIHPHCPSAFAPWARYGPEELTYFKWSTQHYLDGQSKSCAPNIRRRLPATPFFVQHYRFLSFEEYMAVRGTSTAPGPGGNGPNFWAQEPKRKWMQGNYRGRCFPAMNFTKDMALLVHKQLSKRWANGVGPPPASGATDWPLLPH